MKNSISIKNLRKLSSVGELKKIFDAYLDETELVAETKNAMNELYVGITNRV